MIGIRLDDGSETFSQDIRELIQEFFPGEAFEVISPSGIRLENASKEEKAAFKACGEKDLRENFVINTDPSVKATRRMQKSLIKKKLYRELTEKTGFSLPWGTLTGIRPVSLVTQAVEEKILSGEDLKSATENVKRDLREEFLISEDRLRRIVEIAYSEIENLERLKILTGRSYKEGYSLYIGIPFCPTRCLYCSFLSNNISIWEDRIPEYMEALRYEITRTKEFMDMSGKALQTLYIGGGTPTSLNEYWLSYFLNMLSELLGPGIQEFTLEAGRPDSLNMEKLKIIKSYGITRISINPQTFNDKTLKIIGRHHKSLDVEEKFLLSRDLGFDNINMDIILGLPGEHLSDVENSLRRISCLKPDSLTVHTLALKRASRLKEEDVMWQKEYMAGREAANERKRGELPEIFQMMGKSEETASALGLKAYYLYRQKNMAGNLENTGYTLPGKECLYNILMMEEKHTVLGCGAGTSTKAVFPDREGRAFLKRVERCDNGKDIGLYLKDYKRLTDRKLKLLSDKGDI